MPFPSPQTTIKVERKKNAQIILHCDFDVSLRLSALSISFPSVSYLKVNFVCNNPFQFFNLFTYSLLSLFIFGMNFLNAVYIRVIHRVCVCVSFRSRHKMWILQKPYVLDHRTIYMTNIWWTTNIRLSNQQWTNEHEHWTIPWPMLS